MGEWRVGRSEGILLVAELRQELMRKERFGSVVEGRRHTTQELSIYFSVTPQLKPDQGPD